MSKAMWGIKRATIFAFVCLLVIVGLLPLLKSAAPSYFPSMDGFTDSRQPDCVNMTCDEGQFCQNSKCIQIAPRYPNAVPRGNDLL
jgi:hypothetical protein